MAEKAKGVALLDYFSGLKDPRQVGKDLFPLDQMRWTPFSADAGIRF